MNIFTKFDLPTKFESCAMGTSLHIYEKSQNHTSMTIFTNCVYALNKNTHEEF